MATGSDLEEQVKKLRWYGENELADTIEVMKSKLDRIEAYARDRAYHAKHPILNTVGSARIASDLFNILDVEYDWEGWDE